MNTQHHQQTAIKNSSGQGAKALIPPEIQRWNWGAFLLNWIWGLGNSVYLALLMFVPVVNLVVMILLGLKGNVWAWQNKHWHSVSDFQQTQRVWSIAGFVVWGLGVLVAVTIVIFFMFVVGLMKQSEAYRLSLERLKNDGDVIAVLGQPLETGLVGGRISYNNGHGTAEIHYAVEGPMAEGRANVTAETRNGQWEILTLDVNIEDRLQRIIVVPPPSEL